MVGCGAAAFKRLPRRIETQITSVTACLITATLIFERLNYVVVWGINCRAVNFHATVLAAAAVAGSTEAVCLSVKKKTKQHTVEEIS